MKKLLTKTYFAILFVAICIFANIQTANAQKKMDRIERQQMRTMLSTIKGDIRDNYYDKTFKGIDLDKRFEKAEKRIKEVKTTGEALGVIAQVLMDFNDSHVYFQPPLTNLDIEYGWRSRMIGDKCFVTTVKPKSDAAKKGLKAGDQILTIEGFRPTRRDFRNINRYFNTINKRSTLNLTILKPRTEKPVKLRIDAKIKKRPRVITEDTIYKLLDTTGDIATDRHITAKFGKVGIWKMPSFVFAPSDVERLIGTFSDSSSLIFDLRDNGGGFVVTLEKLVGFLFDRDLKIADLKGRKEMKPQKAKTEGNKIFKGKVIVLINSNSGSAAEIFARLIQLEKRGIVIGDISAGAVMQSRSYVNSIGNDSIYYGSSITNADVIMSDGKSIEHVGVMPNARILPTGLDMAKGHDPVLSEAIKLLGGNVSPKEAGSLFKYKWRYDGSIIIELNKK